MLEPDPEIRPDIYQVSVVAFLIQGKECPVQNLYVSVLEIRKKIQRIRPSNLPKLYFPKTKLNFIISQKVATPTIETLPSATVESESIKKAASVKVAKQSTAALVEGTSVTPRQRPKGQGVGTGPISLSGQIVSQISGQGGQITSQNPAGNSVSYVQVNQSTSSVNTPHQYLAQSVQQPASAITTGQQLPPLQLSMQSSFNQVSPHISSPNQNISFVPQTSPFGQSQSPLIAQSPLAQKSPITVQDKSGFYFEAKQLETKPATAGTGGDNLEALFPPSGNFIIH